MRITCKQCGKNIQSELCIRYCDKDKRLKQFQEVQKEQVAFIKGFREGQVVEIERQIKHIEKPDEASIWAKQKLSL